MCLCLLLKWVGFRESQNSYEKITFFRDPAPLWLLPAKRPIGWVGFPHTCSGMTRHSLYNFGQCVPVVVEGSFRRPEVR